MVPMVKAVFTAIAKTKKKTWVAMKGAFNTAKQASGSFGIMASALKSIAPIIRTFNALLKIIGASILKTLMPVLIPFLKVLTDPVMIALMEEIGRLVGMVLVPVLMAFTWVLELLIPVVKVVTDMLGGISSLLRIAGNGFIWFINIIIGGINSLLKLITFGMFKGIPKIPSLQSGTSSVPYTGLYQLHSREQVIPANEARTKNSEIHIHLNIRDAVIDNIDRFTQKMVEQVMIQIG